MGQCLVANVTNQQSPSKTKCSNWSDVFRRNSREEPLMNLLNILSEKLQPLYAFRRYKRELPSIFYSYFWYADQVNYYSTSIVHDMPLKEL